MRNLIYILLILTLAGAVFADWGLATRHWLNSDFDSLVFENGAKIHNPTDTLDFNGTNILLDGEVYVTGNVEADTFKGDGSLLAGIPSGENISDSIQAHLPEIRDTVEAGDFTIAGQWHFTDTTWFDTWVEIESMYVIFDTSEIIQVDSLWAGDADIVKLLINGSNILGIISDTAQIAIDSLAAYYDTSQVHDTLSAYADTSVHNCPWVNDCIDWDTLGAYWDTTNALGSSSMWADSGTFIMVDGQKGVFGYGNVGYGNADSTHVNLGVACTTGLNLQNYKYCTVSGGIDNVAGHKYATVGGGWNNVASDFSTTISGGKIMKQMAIMLPLVAELKISLTVFLPQFAVGGTILPAEKILRLVVESLIL